LALVALVLFARDRMTYHPERIRNRVQAPHYAVPKHNGYDHYVEAGRLAKEAETREEQRGADRFARVMGFTNAGPPSPDELRGYLAAFQPAFAEMRRGLSEESVVTPRDLAPRSGFERSSGFRSLALAMSLAVTEASARGDYETATRTALEGLRLSQETARGGDALESLTSRAICGMLFAAIREDLVPRCTDARVLRELASGLAALEARQPSMADALAQGCAGETRTLEAILRDRRVGEALERYSENWVAASRAFGKQPTARDWAATLGQEACVLAMFLNPTGVVQRMQDMYRPVIEQCRRPYYTRSGGGSGHATPRGIVGVTLGPSATIVETEFRTLADWRIIRTMVALRRYEQEHGAYPDTLERLVPDYLAAIPVDPFGGGLLRYRRQATSYVVYSVGLNLRDDGGAKGNFPGDPKAADYAYWP
jgi:hypothetical protein